MKQPIVPLLLVLFTAMPVWAQAREQSRTPAESVALLNTLFEAADESDLVPGFAVAIVVGDAPVYLRGFGVTDVSDPKPVDADTIFYIASSTKSYVGMLAAILDAKGLMDLDATLDTWIDRHRFHPAINPAAITLRDLLDHTHGIAPGSIQIREAFFGNGSHEDLLALIAHHGPSGTGRRFRYSNTGYNLAAMAMQEHLGASWKELLQEHLLGPAKLRATTPYASTIDARNRASGHRLTPDGHVSFGFNKQDATMSSAGGIATSATDLARWLELNMNDGMIDDERVVPARAVRTAHRVTATNDASYGPFGRTGYALGWHSGQLNGDEQRHHFGGFAGWSAQVSFMPEHRIGIAIIANDSPSAVHMSLEATTAAYAILRGVSDAEATVAASIARLRELPRHLVNDMNDELAQRAIRAQALPRPLESYAGTFHSPELGTLILEIVERRLRARIGVASSAVEVLDADAELLRVELTPSVTTLTMLFRADGAAASGCIWNGFRFERVED